MKNIKVKQIIEETICVFNLEEDGWTNDELKQVIYSRGDEKKSKTNIKALMTDYQTFDKPFKKLGNSILKCFPEFYLEYVSNYKDIPFSPEIVNMWGAAYKGNDLDHTVPHRHLTYFCGFCYYIEAPINCAPIVFPSTFGKYKIHPKAGDLIMFGGHLEHCVPTAIHDGERIVIAGNIKLR